MPTTHAANRARTSGLSLSILPPHLPLLGHGVLHEVVEPLADVELQAAQAAATAAAGCVGLCLEPT